MKSVIKSFFKDESGATAIEYGLIAAGISIAIITRRERSRHQAQLELRYHQQLAEVIAHFGAVSGPGAPSARSLSFWARDLRGEISTFLIHSRGGHLPDPLLPATAQMPASSTAAAASFRQPSTGFSRRLPPALHSLFAYSPPFVSRMRGWGSVVKIRALPRLRTPPIHRAPRIGSPPAAQWNRTLSCHA